MAAELVGGAFLSSFLSVLFDRIASREVVDFFHGRKLNHRLLKKLETTMIAVNGVLDDAEEQQITKPAVKKWVTELKDAVYEADDFLDEIAYEALKLQVEAGSATTIHQVSNFLSSINPFKKGLDLEGRLEEILERLEDLVKQKDVLGLREGNIGEKQFSQRTPTTSLVDESGVCGRDADKEAIMKMVLQSESDDASCKKLVVIPIVGMGGIGKTTLAQLVYNDSRVKQRFDLKAWVCVSEENDALRVTKDIVTEMASVNCHGKTPNQLQLELKDRLMGKRFMLVLDDVWNYGYEFWNILQRPFQFAAKGSVIIVTTRNESVAEVMRTVPTHHLKELSNEDSWLLFAKHAFAEEDSSVYRELEVVGRQIVKKCNGLPLATKTLGGLLRAKRNVNEWMKILKSNLWELPDDNILPALRLSYQYLPSHLKRCFAYCALFPKDYRFDSEELVLLWMAEGFLEQPKGQKDPQEIGDEYIQDLLSRSFFHRQSDDPEGLLMHDLIHDMAESVSEEICMRLEDNHSCKIGIQTRHFSYIVDRDVTAKKKVGDVHKALFLRTFLTLRRSYMAYSSSKIDWEMLSGLLQRLNRSRVLCLSGDNNITILWDSIGNMRHLRYLNLESTPITRLPDSVQNLYNLQVLILALCQHLIELPTNTMNLINLCYIDIRWTKVQEMPLQMGKLVKLIKLSDFIVGKQSGSSISELGELQHLQGRLRIKNLQNVSNPQDAFEANLKGKKRLEELGLEWTSDSDDSLHDRNVLEKLQPHINLKNLEIMGYGGTKFPDWVGDSSFSSMVYLRIHGCKNCLFLSPLGQLGFLKRLQISSFNEIVIVGPEFYGSLKRPFPSLESLSFSEMPQWQEWVPFVDNNDEGGGFPVLKELFMDKCPNLTKALPSYLPRLTTLRVCGCHEQLVASLPKAPQLLQLIVERLPSLDYLMVEQMPSLSTIIKSLSLSKCNSVKCFPIELFPKLESLYIYKFPNLEKLIAESMHSDFTSLNSLEIIQYPNLRVLFLYDCKNLKSLPKYLHSHFPSLQQLKINNCPEVESFPEGGLPSKLKELRIVGCNKLFAGRKQWNLQLLPSLSSFDIGSNEDMESFPESILLPSSLSFPHIEDFKNLKWLDYKGLQHLTALADLRINGCNKLQRLPEEGLPSSIDHLWIYNCSLLEQRCQRDKGEDWPKISHIPDIIINLVNIN